MNVTVCHVCMCHQKYIISNSVCYFMIFVQRPVACILCMLFKVYGADDTQGISRVTWSFSSILNYPCIKNFTKKNCMYFQASCRCITSFFLCILSCMFNFYTVNFMFPPERYKFPVNMCVNIKTCCLLFTVFLYDIIYV